MKKIISILAVLTMLFSVFAMVPAYAEETVYEGTFNIPYEAKSVSENQHLYLNLSKGTVPENATIAVTAKYNSAAASGSNPFSNKTETVSYTNTNFGKDIENDGTRIRIYPLNSTTKMETDWMTNTGAEYKKNGQLWKIEKVTINEETVYETGKSTAAVARFCTQNLKELNSCTVENNAEGVAADKEIIWTFTQRLSFGSRGEESIVTVTEDGVPLTRDEDFEFSFTASDSTYKTYYLKPLDSWKEGTTYVVNIKHCTDAYDPSGTVIDNGALLWEETRTFTTAGEKPVAPAEDYTYAVTKDNSTYTVNVTANKETKSAMIVLIGKNDSTGLIGSVKAVNPFTLTKGTPASERITIASGETFYAYLWENGTMVPIRNVITEADITQ